MKIALHMILAGDEKPVDLKRCLDSIKDQVDGIYLTITTPMKGKGLLNTAKEYNAIVDYEPQKFFFTVDEKMIKWLKKFGITPHSKVGDKLFQFDKARNHNMAQVPKEYQWIIWLDADDIFRGDKLREIVKLAEEKKLDSIFLNYLYQVEIKDGKVVAILIQHLRERIFRHDGSYKWVAPIHETVIEQRPTNKADVEWCDVLHLSTNERRSEAVYRNIKTLELSIYQKKGKDPRPIYYIAKSYYDLWLIKQDKKYLEMAKPLMMSYLEGEHKSGWTEERSQCWEYLTEIYRCLGEYNNSIKCAHNAMIEDERFPSIYLNLALCYLTKKEYNRALFWVKQAARMDVPKSTLVVSPRDLQAKALEIVYNCSLQTSLLDEAWRAAKQLKAMFPEMPIMSQREVFCHQLIEQRELTKIYTQAIRFLQQSGETAKIVPLMSSVPDFIADNPIISDLMNQVLPPRRWADNEIMIYVGSCFTRWDAKTIDNPGENFVGGSEEAVIRLSAELAKLGWKVTVYGDPENEGEYDGVKYVPHYKMNKKDQFNIIVSWRRPDFVELKAKKTYIWMHDIANALDFPKERLDKITKVIVLSPWHRSNLPDVDDSKILISSNGI